ncbi:MAG TPA: phosphatidate cytidylyltransferase, partial [Acidimicrobiales bacterium]|nr:phosphatidate cytidylyltransferase [Acidimicrobiales bacterium]
EGPLLDEFQTDDRTEAAQEDVLSTNPGPAWSGVARGPRPPAEGVRIIGAEEAAAAIESGQVSPRVPDDAPRFGDVPEAPSGPHPSLRFPGSDPAAVTKPPVVDPPPPPPPPVPPPTEAPAPSFASPSPPPASWSGAFDSKPLPSDDPSGFWDPPVVPTAAPGRFEELVAAAAKAEAEAQAPVALGTEAPGAPPRPPAPAPAPELREITRDHPLTSNSGEWAVASGLGGNVGPPARSGGSRPPAAEGGGRLPAGEGRSLTGAGPGPASPQSDWDRLTGTTSGGRSVGEGDGGSWEFFDEPGEAGRPRPAAASGASDDPPTMSLPHWTEPPSGEVPRILADSPAPGAAADDELSAWSALSTGPRWRDQPADWDEADFHDTVLDDREARLGALRDQPEVGEEGDLFSFDDEAPPPPVPAAVGQGRGATTQVRPTRKSRGKAPGGGSRSAGPVAPGGGPAGSGGGGGGTDISTRIVTGVIVAGVVLAAAAIGPRALMLIVLAAVTMAAAELFQSLRTRGYQPATLLGLVGCASMVAGAYWRGETAFPLVLTLMVIFSFLWYLAGVVHAKPTMNIAVTLFAFLYVGFLGSFAALFLRVPNEQGVGILLGAVIVTAGHDIGAYLVGKYMGKTPLAPELSPNKTFEGLVGGVLASVGVSLLVVSQIGPWDLGKAFWLGVVVAITAPLGDLCESMIKRDLGVKDMGKLLPGHGGVLDRIDALLFVIPATYYLWSLLV